MKSTKSVNRQEYSDNEDEERDDLLENVFILHDIQSMICMDEYPIRKREEKS